MDGVVYGLSVDGVNHMYVGQTKHSAEHRLAGHLAEARESGSPLYWWIRHHLSEGRAIRTTVLERCPAEALSATEKHWIFILRERGYPLLNRTRGGAGTMGFRPPRPPRDQITTGYRNPWDDPAYRARMKAKMNSDEYRARMSRAKKGVKQNHSKQRPRANPAVSCVKCHRETKMTGLHNHLLFCLR